MATFKLRRSVIGVGTYMSKIIYKKIAQEIESGRNAWLVTVINVSGSAPGKVGFKMLVNSEGSIAGTVGGGTVEMCVIKKIVSDRPSKALRFAFDLGEDGVGEKTGMVCGGMQEVLVEPLFSNSELYIIGGGHCGKALSELAAKCDFDVTVIDERPEHLDQQSHPYACKLIHAPYRDVSKHVNFANNTFIVVMTHNHSSDELVMRSILGKEYAYLGVIGSNNKAKTFYTKLLQEGYDPQELSKVFMPIGFDIGSETPCEISISILAQIIAVKKEVDGFAFNSNPLLNGNCSVSK